MQAINTNYGYEEEEMFGMVHCRECGEAWLKEFVPAVCTKCGNWLTSTPGTGFEPELGLLEQIGLPAPAFHCEHCGKRISEQFGSPWCPYCKGDISHMTRRSRRMFMRVWRRLGIYWWSYNPFRRR